VEEPQSSPVKDIYFFFCVFFLKVLKRYLTPYLVVATGEDCGMIEVVLNSSTTGEIQRERGGASAAFKKTPIAEWLAEKNKAAGGPERLRLAVNNFVTSLAGYW
jgi:phosphatidylinositol-4,5-bisphosphate 3-kinase